ncbi:MAG: hypothetical protein M1816_000448 [Peltula sp. TS41687]|nr:MAG: hypothetical protein M1816_000448 [Peltula sp. TS41687]
MNISDVISVDQGRNIGDVHDWNTAFNQSSFSYSNGLSGSNKAFRIAAFTISITSIFGAILVFCSILYVAWQTSKGQRVKAGPRSWILPTQSDKFLIALAVAVAVQGAMFAGIQSVSLVRAMDHRCADVSQTVWIGKYFHVYDLTRIGYRTFLHAAGAGYGLLKSKNQCQAQLASWVSGFCGVAIMIFCGLLVLSIAGAAVLCVQLRQTVKLGGEERLYSIRCLCYLGLLIIFSIITLPFIIHMVISKDHAQSAMVVSTSLNSLGLTTNMMYFILQTVKRRYESRLAESQLGNEESAGHVSKSTKLSRKKTDAAHQMTPLVAPPIKTPVDPSLGSGPIETSNRSKENQDQPAQKEKITPEASTPQSPARGRPSRLEIHTDRPMISSPIPSSATLAPGMMTPNARSDGSSLDEDSLRLIPQPLFAQGRGRNPSMMTSATVEFGLRLSDAPSQYRVSASIDARRSQFHEESVDWSVPSEGGMPLESPSTPSLPQSGQIKRDEFTERLELPERAGYKDRSLSGGELHPKVWI